ncbi:MAG: Crp/Fnr family transcriptional regulator [Planctomycetes bacterium]|nr:Crp/Fnr family transcriptional regulator [Planctomycetota bacterium]
MDLSSFPMFQQITACDREGLARCARETRAPAGEMVFRDGDAARGFYLVKSGAVKVYKIAPDGRERVLNVFRAGQSFAEAAIFGVARYPAFAQAMEDSSLVCVDAQGFIRLLRENADFALRVIESLARRMHWLLAQLEAEAFLGARARLANFLLGRLAADGKNAGLVALTEARKEIAARLNMAPETFSRAQRDLADNGLIRVESNAITVPDGDRLRDFLLSGGQ